MKEKETANITEETKEDIGFDVRPSTVFFEQWYQIIKDYPPKERDKAYKYIFEYAFYGIEPEKTKVMSLSYSAFGMAKPNIDSAQKRYDDAVENGQKGGRPKKVTEEVREKIQTLRKNGLTQKEVAIQLGLSLKTIQRVEKDKSQNHNVNVNVNDNINDNVDVNSVASDEDNRKTASPITEASLPASPSTPIPTELTWEQYTLLMNTWELSQGSGKSPTHIAQELNLNIKLCNQAITEYKNNGYKRRCKPSEKKILDVPLLNGGYLNQTKEELFNNETNNGKLLVNDIVWKSIEDKYIATYGIEQNFAKKLVKEFRQRLQNINDTTRLKCS